MGLLDTLLYGTSSKDLTIRSQAKKITELENVVENLVGEVDNLKHRLQELSDVISYVTTVQQQMADDMGTIYENVRAVGEALHGHSVDAEDKYFSWRWGLPDDDDDLPN